MIGRPGGTFTVVIPARNEAELLPSTLAALQKISEVREVLVVDDASVDATARIAASAGAQLMQRSRSDGKAGALMLGAEEALRRRADANLVFLDADVGDSGRHLSPLLAPVATGELDLAIAKYSARGAGGGRGRVVRMARAEIGRQTGWVPDVPLSGIRAMTAEAYRAVTPLARGWGVEVAMTLDAFAAGLRVAEVQTAMTHRATGTDWAAKIHRGQQFADAWWAIKTRTWR